MTVNPSTMRLGIAAILVGLVGAYGVRVAMEEDEGPPPEVKAETYVVPLASQDLPIGRIIRKGDISLRPMNANSMKREGMPLELVMMAPEQIIGRQLRKQMRLGDPFLTTAVYLEAAGPTYELKPGYRAVAVSVPVARGGYAKAGDVVDVYFTSSPRAADARLGQRLIPMKTVPVVNAVTILDVAHATVTASPSLGGHPSFLLQVLPDKVPLIQALFGHGEFSFMIRPADDVALVAGTTKGMTIEEALGLADEPQPQPQPTWVTEYYRGQNRNAQQFPIAQPSPQQVALMQQQLAQQQLAEQQAKQAQPRTFSPLSRGAVPAAEDAGEVLPMDRVPVRTPRAPARRRPAPTLREPELPTEAASGDFSPEMPYRFDQPASNQAPPRTATPLPRNLLSAAVNAADAVANPFGEDAKGELMP